MKMLIATDTLGQVVGAVLGGSMTAKHEGLTLSVAFAPGHVLHEVEVEDDMAAITDAVEFEKRLYQHLPKA